MKLDLDTKLRCDDDATVLLADVVIDPRHRRVTHLVVRAHGLEHRAFLVPVDRIDTDDPTHPRLHVDEADLTRFPEVTVTDFLRVGDNPVAEPGWAVGIEEVLAMPHFDAEYGSGWYDDHYTLGWDRIPADEIEIRRHSVVTAGNGREVGHVEGFVCDADGMITHLVLQRGHLFGTRDLAIPIGSVTRLANDRVRVELTPDEISRLPDVTVRPWRHRPS